MLYSVLENAVREIEHSMQFGSAKHCINANIFTILYYSIRGDGSWDMEFKFSRTKQSPVIFWTVEELNRVCVTRNNDNSNPLWTRIKRAIFISIFINNTIRKSHYELLCDYYSFDSWLNLLSPLDSNMPLRLERYRS